MGFIKRFKSNHSDLFVYLKAEEVLPHDHFLARTILRLLPDSVTPNQISIFRIIATPFVFYLTLNGFFHAGIFSFIFVAFTDALDGSLARTKDKITRFGMMIDPMADKLLIGSMALLLVFRYLNVWLGIIILALEIIFIIAALVSKIKFKTVRMANQWGKIKMGLQVVAMCSILFALVLDVPALFSVATGVFGISVGFALVSLYKHGI